MSTQQHPADQRTGDRLTGAGRLGRLAVEFAPAYLVSLLLLPAIIAGGDISPWTPQTIDLQVYYHAVRAMLDGQNIMEFTSPGWNLYFIYPPVAAILMLPLAVGPYLFWQLVWIAGLILAQNAVMIRCGLPRGWVLGLVSVALVIGMEPIRTTVGYGQINTLLMLLVVLDLLSLRDRTKRRLPVGVLIGIAAAVKLTPALFVLLLLILGKRRPAITAIATFVLLTAIGTIFQPDATISYVRALAGGDTHTSGPLYVGNQSMLGVVLRLFGETPVNSVLGIAVAMIIGVLAAVVGAYWWRQGGVVLAIALVGLGSNLASPLSWTHHFVWILPLAIAVLHQVAGRPWPGWQDTLRLPRWLTASGAVLVIWVSACLPLALLPYASGAEQDYSAIQQFVANFGPLLATAMMIGSAVWMLAGTRDRTAVRQG